MYMNICIGSTSCPVLVRRFGECVWDERKASVLQAMLVSAVQRRFPPGEAGCNGRYTGAC